MGIEALVSATIIKEHPKYFEVVDPLLGNYPLSKHGEGIDGVMADIISAPLGQRAFDLTQLSKAGPHTTIPGTESFHRLGHIIGVGEITARLARQKNLPSETTIAYALKASLSDLGHGPFSHATDIAVQGQGSDETFHESRIEEALVLGGIQRVLQAHDIRVNHEGVIDGYSIPPWVESSAPDVCVDRLQYTLQELLLWFDGSSSLEADTIHQTLCKIASLESITINDTGNMIFEDLNQARLFSKGYLLLSTEHWNNPVNRVQLYLLIESLKYSILSRRLPGMQQMDNGVTRKPFDYLYATDSDVLAAMQSEPGNTDPYLFVLENQLADIGHEEQNRFIQFRRRVYEQFLIDNAAEEYPSSILHPNLADFGPPSSRFEIELLAPQTQPTVAAHPQVPQLVGENSDLHYVLNPLKNRFIDPMVRVGADVKRLSETDSSYRILLEQHQRIQRSPLKVHIPTTKAYKDLLWQKAQEVSADFFAAQESNEPLNRDPKRRGIEAASRRAIIAATSRGHYIDLR